MMTISANLFNQTINSIIAAGDSGCWIEDDVIRALKEHNRLQFWQTSSCQPELSIASHKVKLEFRLVNPRNYEWCFTISSQTGMRKSINLTWLGNLSNPKTDQEQGKMFRNEVGLIFRQFLVQSGIKFIPS